MSTGPVMMNAGQQLQPSPTSALGALGSPPLQHGAPPAHTPPLAPAGGQLQGPRTPPPPLASLPSTAAVAASSASPASVLPKLEELLFQVNSLRSGCGHIFQTFQDVARAPDGGQLSKAVSNHVRNVVRSLKRVTELGKELQPYLVPLNSSADGPDTSSTRSSVFTEEPLMSIQGAIEAEAKWREIIQKRGHTAKRVFEEQVRLKFPLLADDAPNKRRRLEIADPHALAIRAALNGDSTQEQRLLAEVGRGRVLEISPLHQEGSLVGITVVRDGVFRARVLFRLHAPRHAMPDGPQSDRATDGEGNLMADHIVVCGIEEDLPSDTASFISVHRAFQAITANAVLAAQHYAKRALQTSAPPASPVRKLLRWLESFGSVFGEACRGCKRYLYNDSEHLLFLPPTWRTLDKQLPYHPQCLSAFPHQ